MDDYQRRPELAEAVNLYRAAANVIETSALSDSSTLNMGRGRRFMKLATKVSGICWMRMLNVFTESQLFQRSVAADLRDNLNAGATSTQATAALWEAEYGNLESARRAATIALGMAPGESAKILAALALAEVKDGARAEAIARELSQRLPKATMLNNVWLPTIRAQIEISRRNPVEAIELLQAALPYDLVQDPPRPFVYPVYARGQAYLRAQQASAVVAEFQKILDHRSLTGGFPLEPLSHLGLARAMSGDNAGARTAYQDFFALWKDADPEIPILKEAKAEYANLQ